MEVDEKSNEQEDKEKGEKENKEKEKEKVIVKNSYWTTRPTQSWPEVTTFFTHVVRLSVRPRFHNLAKRNNMQLRIVIATGGIVGLAEGIIDDSCLVILS